MRAAGYTAGPVPQLDPRSPRELYPNEQWVRKREKRDAGGVQQDVYYLCERCTEAALLRDPRVRLNPFWVTKPDGTRHDTPPCAPLLPHRRAARAAATSVGRAI